MDKVIILFLSFLFVTHVQSADQCMPSGILVMFDGVIKKNDFEKIDYFMLDESSILDDILSRSEKVFVEPKRHRVDEVYISFKGKNKRSSRLRFQIDKKNKDGVQQIVSFNMKSFVENNADFPGEINFEFYYKKSHKCIYTHRLSDLKPSQGYSPAGNSSTK